MAKINRPTTFYATISVTIVLILVSLFLTLFLHTGNITNILKQNINLLVEVQDVMHKSELDRLVNIIKNSEGVITEKVEFIEKEKAMEFMAGEFKTLHDLVDNPFKDIIKFNLKADFYTEKKILALKESLELEKGVLGFYYENEGLELIKKNLTHFSMVILGLAIIFVILSIAIIYNTLRLTLFADEKKIKTMYIVGATGRFIRKPYYIWAIKMSFIATFFVVLVLGVIYSYALLYNALLFELLDPRFLILTIIICFFISMLITLGASRLILKQFLMRSLS
ncbi:MAG: FtsX-like permease family protein [Saprospiraceae bacterium]